MNRYQGLLIIGIVALLVLAFKLTVTPAAENVPFMQSWSDLILIAVFGTSAIVEVFSVFLIKPRFAKAPRPLDIHQPTLWVTREGESEYKRRNIFVLDLIFLNLGYADAKKPFLNIVFGKVESTIRDFPKAKMVAKSGTLERQFDLFAPRRAATDQPSIMYDDFFYLFYQNILRPVGTMTKGNSEHFTLGFSLQDDDKFFIASEKADSPPFIKVGESVQVSLIAQSEEAKGVIYGYPLTIEVKAWNDVRLKDSKGHELLRHDVV